MKNRHWVWVLTVLIYEYIKTQSSLRAHKQNRSFRVDVDRGHPCHCYRFLRGRCGCRGRRVCPDRLCRRSRHRSGLVTVVDVVVFTVATVTVILVCVFFVERTLLLVNQNEDKRKAIRFAGLIYIARFPLYGCWSCDHHQMLCTLGAQ